MSDQALVVDCLIAAQHFSGASDGLGLLNKVLDLVVPALAELVMRPKEDGVSLKVCCGGICLCVYTWMQARKNKYQLLFPQLLQLVRPLSPRATAVFLYLEPHIFYLWMSHCA